MKMDDMEHKVTGAKKSSLQALHKLMKDLHHKSMHGDVGSAHDEGKEPHEASVEIDVMHSPLSESEHDEENKGPGVNPFNDSQMEGDQAAELAEHSHNIQDSEEHPQEDAEDESEDNDMHSDMKLPEGIHALLMKHKKK